MRSSKEKVSRADLSYHVVYSVVRRPSGDDVELVAQMRHLGAIRRLGGKPDFEITVTKNLGRAPRRSRQLERRTE